MANYYRILSAYSDDGEDLSVPVPWNLDSVDDLSVVIVGDSGKPQEIDYWNWDSQLKQIEIPNSQNFKVWSAYVSRKEDAVALFQLIESHEINAQNILEQFQKISRILESLQENEKTFLSSPDYMGGLLPNASHRASKFVSFDEDGKPVCDIPTETFDDAVGFMEKAVGEAEEAFGEIVTAKTAEFNSNAASKKSEIDALVDTAEGYKTAAAESAQAAATSQTASAQSETNAQASATAAAQSESNALASKNAAEAAAQIAQETDAGALMLSKLGAGQLWFNRGKLSGSNFPIPTFPFSICAQVRIDGWKGASDVSQSIFQCGTYGSTQLVSLGFSDTSSFPRLGVQVSSTSGGTTTSSAFRCNFDYSDFIGKDHTIVAVCRNLDSSDTLDWSIYLDGEAMTGSPTKDLKIDALGGSVNYAVNTTNGNFPSNAACANPMRLSRLAVFNFDMSADGAPYTVADYVSGKLVPPALYDPAAAQRALLALEDYSIAVGATRYVPDVSGNAYDATVVESGGSGDTAWTGTVKGSRDTAIKRLCDLINANNQSA